jgi:hypothetical protein
MLEIENNYEVSHATKKGELKEIAGEIFSAKRTNALRF